MRTLTLSLLFSATVAAQIGPPSSSGFTQVVAAPTGNACQANSVALQTPVGKIYTCFNGIYVLTASGPGIGTVTAVNASITTASLGTQAICALHTDSGCLNNVTDATAANCPAGTLTAACTFPTSITIPANALGSTITSLTINIGSLNTATVPTGIIEIYLDSTRIYASTATAGAAGTRSGSFFCTMTGQAANGASVPLSVGCSSASAGGTVNSFASNTLNTNAAPAISIDTTASHILKVSMAYGAATTGNSAWLYGIRFTQ